MRGSTSKWVLQHLSWTDHLATNQNLKSLISEKSQCGSAHFAGFSTSKKLKLAARVIRDSSICQKWPKNKCESCFRGLARVCMVSRKSQRSPGGNARLAKHSIRWLKIVGSAKRIAFILHRHPTLYNLGKKKILKFPSSIILKKQLRSLVQSWLNKIYRDHQSMIIIARSIGSVSCAKLWIRLLLAVRLKSVRVA
jgi:hypothetical protein